MEKNQVKPTIIVYVNPNTMNDNFNDVLWGIEEEGIPYLVIKDTEEQSEALAYAAANQSVLGVGIGVDNDNITLHYNKLQLTSPLFSISCESSPLAKRELGSNAARLVKKTPFKI